MAVLAERGEASRQFGRAETTLGLCHRSSVLGTGRDGLAQRGGLGRGGGQLGEGDPLVVALHGY